MGVAVGANALACYAGKGVITLSSSHWAFALKTFGYLGCTSCDVDGFIAEEANLIYSWAIVPQVKLSTADVSSDGERELAILQKFGVILRAYRYATPL